MGERGEPRMFSPSETCTMNKLIACASALLLASVASADVYTDALFDTFTNNDANLDIDTVMVTDNGVDLSIAITTRGFQNWTKYMVFMNTNGGGDGSNAWSRPVNLNGQTCDRFAGTWVDQGSSNVQLVNYVGAGWDWGNFLTLNNGVAGNTVTLTFSLASLGLSPGGTMYFDVATSGGGNDPGVDHLSRSTLATNGWGEPSTAGQFLAYTVTPAPGAVALLGLAGLVGGRRRR